jgi:hypothetical protein
MAFLIPGVETTFENGATLVSFLALLADGSRLVGSKVLPGSHLWGQDRWPKLEGIAYATMQKGDAYCMLGRWRKHND